MYSMRTRKQAFGIQTPIVSRESVSRTQNVRPCLDNHHRDRPTQLEMQRIIQTSLFFMSKYLSPSLVESLFLNEFSSMRVRAPLTVCLLRSIQLVGSSV